MITILASGPQTLVEDLGRPGLAHLGVPRSGAADRVALRLANRLVGNPESAAGLEMLLGGLELQWHGSRPLWMALTGAQAQLVVGGRREPAYATVLAQPGDRVRVDVPRDGIRSYLAVRGGLDVPAVLGSRSTDLLSGLGPAPVRDGDELAIGSPTAPLPGVSRVPQPLPHPGTPALRVAPGPRRSWFTEDAVRTLTSTSWTVAPDSDRTAVRLDGPALQRRVTDELPSEGLVRGAVQVPPSGLPLVFLADHPVTGGYPVIAVLAPEAVDRIAHLRPGDRVRFRPPLPDRGQGTADRVDERTRTDQG